MSGKLAHTCTREALIWTPELRAMGRQIAQPLLDRLGPRWISEEKALAGLKFPRMRLFWARELGFVEIRARGFFRRRWCLRLSQKGWAEE